MTEITDLNPVDESNTSLTGNGITGGNFVSNFDNAMRGLLGLLGRLNSGAAPIADTFTLADPADLTKRFRFDGGLITAGQTRVITVPDTNITLGAGTAASITFTPAGNIAATDVQAAIQELDSEKQPLNTQLTDIAALAVTDSNIIVGNGTTWVAESGATARTSLGLGTGNAPQFTAVNIGNATDTTISRASAGDVQVEGNLLYRAGGTDVPLADGGTGASLTDPNADRIMFWDDSGGAVTWLSLGTGLAFNVTSLDLDADLASWSAVTRASGFDTFTATPSIANLMSLLTDDASGLGTFMTTPSSANLRSLLTDEDGTGPALFGGSSYIREKLTANRTYYVRTDGSDSNTGLADNAGGAKLTIASALTAAAALDCSTYDVTIQVRDGTFTGAFSLPLMIGSGTFTLIGNTTTPANCIISKTGSDAVPATDCGAWTVRGFKLQTTTSGNGIAASGRTTIRFNTIDFGTIAGAHQFYAVFGANVLITGNYSITGASAYAHMTAAFGGYIQNYSTTVTLTGTPAHTIFAYAAAKGAIDSGSVTFSGAGTGQRYLAEKGGSIETNGGGISYFPGNSAGNCQSGGVYA